ncbi:ribonuclease P subunit p20 family protein [Aspergillus homomorphus CBS 101889]|uniref:Uncharacterized protein n=1 Tax=Aspergillus homomorphus (strain CBS 101889) TaxID=1450537 RepID=A0A395HR65_ASPHC|nr:hypothetical protein BO97DRAFT_444744 [Aspergillus homomorphus CBS 101889]RAL10307.1 hypothetical protein BO97DRAFT_444744 [Aspergillus homomorphus CBS 101889]
MPPEQPTTTTTPKPKPNHNPLHFEKKNQSMTKLPNYAKITKRPIPHPTPPTPYTALPKIIYVSTTTPKMSVVTRVQKFLRQAEKRATAALQNPSGNKRSSGHGQQGKPQAERVARVQEALRREEVHVKATGRAIPKAVAVGEWFGAPGRAEEFSVRVVTGSVLVVDDVEEDEEGRRDAVLRAERMRREVLAGVEEGSGRVLSKAALKKRRRVVKSFGLELKVEDKEGADDNGNEGDGKGEGEELPESRTRWVNMVDVVVGLK